MESGLLNVFHDDSFDCHYINNSDFWSSSSEDMGLQLTETLHGIPPLTAADDTGTDVFKDDFQKEHDKTILSSCHRKEALLYDSLSEQHLMTGGAIEIITVDPNAMSETDSDDDDDDDLEEVIDGDDVSHEFVELDNQSQCSESTFRTRTDSSSIGDYESHTSDYDDDDEDDECAFYQDDGNFAVLGAEEIAQDEGYYMGHLGAGFLTTADVELETSFKLPLDTVAGIKDRTISTNTIGSDVEGFDVNNFDLAEFITNDDFALHTTTKKTKTANTINTSFKEATTTVPVRQMPPALKNESDSDTDSDVIVDIETVEVETPFVEIHGTEDAPSDVPYVDNVAKDPSWSPKQTKKAEVTSKEVKTRTKGNALQGNNSRSFSIIPSKRQCDFLKGKFGTVRSKGSGKQSHPKLASKKAPESATDNIVKPGSLTCRVGVGQGGKNLSLLAEESDYSVNSKETVLQGNATVVEQKTEVDEPQNNAQPKDQQADSKVTIGQCVKRKLNLEEYKQRRGENAASGNMTSSKVVKLLNDTQITPSKNHAQTASTKHSEEVTSIVKSLREQPSHKPSSDPITEAKNKVLRMQELKRAQQIRIIDSAISAKVPRVTKLPPLKDIVKDSYLIESESADSCPATAKKLSDYEEIIIVSVGNNTDITIPPLNILPINSSSRSLLKSSAVLYNTNSSLIASIQDVVVKKVTKVIPSAENVASNRSRAKATNTDATEQHGEDKIIMHLRKDRIQKLTATIETQTDPQSAFPPLTRQRNYRKHSGENEPPTDVSGAEAHPTHISRSRNRHSPMSSAYRSRSRSADSYGSSVERMRQCDAAGSYSSRSSRRHRSSVSSSYSESPECKSRYRRQRRSSYKQRSRKYSRSSSNSSSESDYSDHSYSRNRSPLYRRSRSRSRSCSRRRGYNGSNNHTNRMVSQPAVEERRIVYVGRIEQETTKEMLRRKFLPYGNIKQITIHYKETGMKYGFVTYERSQDAFAVIDSSARDSTINMYDISFGGRRAFCRASYADLDSAGINTYHSFVFPQAQAPTKEEDSFEALLLKVKAKMNANKTATSKNSAAGSCSKI